MGLNIRMIKKWKFTWRLHPGHNLNLAMGKSLLEGAASRNASVGSSAEKIDFFCILINCESSHLETVEIGEKVFSGRDAWGDSHRYLFVVLPLRCQINLVLNLQWGWKENPGTHFYLNSSAIDSRTAVDGHNVTNPWSDHLRWKFWYFFRWILFKTRPGY